MDAKLGQFIGCRPANTARSSCNKRYRRISSHLQFPLSDSGAIVRNLLPEGCLTQASPGHPPTVRHLPSGVAPVNARVGRRRSTLPKHHSTPEAEPACPCRSPPHPPTISSGCAAFGLFPLYLALLFVHA